MVSQTTMEIQAQRASAPAPSAGSGGGSDLVIVVLNELACAGGPAKTCVASHADYGRAV